MELHLNIKISTPEADEFIREFTNSDDYIIVNTSGSTGTPKTIHLPKSDMIRSAKASCEYFGINKKSRLVCPLSANYIAGKMMIIRAAVSGAELIMETPSNTPIARYYGKIDFIPVVPSQLVHLLENQAKAKHIGKVLVGGGPVPQNLVEAIKNAPFHTFASYGMTETSSHVAIKDFRNINDHYLALPGISFDVDDEFCLKIHAPGYSFDGIQTNDIVWLYDHKDFHWVGRRDNVIITGGVKVHIEEIERKISPIMNDEYFVIGVKDDLWGEKVVLYTKHAVDAEALKSLLTKFEMPKEIRIVKTIPHTPTGKILRSEIKRYKKDSNI